MNKSELVECMATDAEISKAAAERALAAFVANVQKAVAAGDTVNLIGFGAFKSVERAARNGKNPKTGEKLTIAATRAPKFSPGAGFKAIVAGK